MDRWPCPECGREFDRPGRGHLCVPGCTVEETFAGRPPGQRAAYEEVLRFLRTLGDVYADVVRVGVFLKSRRTLAELRPMSRWLALYLVLPRRLGHPRVTRVLRMSADRTANVVRLTGPSDVDDELRGWLAEAYLYASD
ncbi:DUF5655 domain-containing protein [Actinocatenispora rupis]|uniref:DUF5655 domain-containing protein n=1 Tax=Actinocatenispora rupis TaxID=519421 RepID=A0A8J3IZJ6_9ACTN|nr:DUF5655 domain-containing protein [Actinocatenispora rupis]GID11468.1 hypothetical protein Aru02nite_23570 [Actinocatenispora rupis]